MNFIYRIIFPNNKSYVGQTDDLFNRIRRGHKKDALIKNSPLLVHRAIRKYGWENIKLDIVDIADDKEQANEKEKYYIQYYDCRNNSYNMTDGGEGGDCLLNPEVRKKHSESLIGKNVGKIRNKEHRINISKGTKLAMNRQEVKEKQIKAKKGKTYEEIYGKEKAEELKKIRRINMNKKYKCIYCGSTNNLCNIRQWHNENCKFKKGNKNE